MKKDHIFSVVVILLLISAFSVSQENADSGDLTLDRIFSSREFAAERMGRVN